MNIFYGFLLCLIALSCDCYGMDQQLGVLKNGMLYTKPQFRVGKSFYISGRQEHVAEVSPSHGALSNLDASMSRDEAISYARDLCRYLAAQKHIPQALDAAQRLTYMQARQFIIGRIKSQGSIIASLDPLVIKHVFDYVCKGNQAMAMDYHDQQKIIEIAASAILPQSHNELRIKSRIIKYIADHRVVIVATVTTGLFAMTAALLRVRS